MIGAVLSDGKQLRHFSQDDLISAGLNTYQREENSFVSPASAGL